MGTWMLRRELLICAFDLTAGSKQAMPERVAAAHLLLTDVNTNHLSLLKKMELCTEELSPFWEILTPRTHLQELGVMSHTSD